MCLDAFKGRYTDEVDADDDDAAAADDLSWLPEDFHVVIGQRGRPKLVHRGYAFTRNKIAQGKSYWSCNQVKQHGCRARLVLWRKLLGVKLTQTEHTHAPVYGDFGLK